MAVFRSVFYELKGKKTNIVLVTLILLVMCILLCTAFLFGRSSKIESALLQQVPIEYEFYNNHYYINTDDRFSGEEYKYDIDYKGWRLEGDFFHWNYDVFEGERLVVRISKQLFRWGDTYVLDVVNDMDELPALMVAIAMDAAQSSDDNNNAYYH